MIIFLLFFQALYMRAQFIIHRPSHLDFVAQTQIACEHVFPEIFRENCFSVFLAVVDEFLLASVQVWEKNSDLKNQIKS